MSPKEYFAKAHENIRELSKEFRNDYLNMQIKNLEQRRALIGYIPGFSAAIITLSVQLLTKPIIREYLSTGLLLHLITIFYVLAYLREHLDKDASDLDEQLHYFSAIIDKQHELTLKRIKIPSPKPRDVDEYLQELENSEDISELERKIEESEKGWDKRKKELEYSSEIAITLFVTASFFILSAIMNWKFSATYLVFTLLIITILTFRNTATYFTNFVSDIINSIRELVNR